eukprot:SAG31_NODE_195_length_20708_cov_9.627638_7_plen_157_part_00
MLDGAVAVLDGVAGAQVQTEKVWHQADRYGIQRIIFVNKLDRQGAGGIAQTILPLLCFAICQCLPCAKNFFSTSFCVQSIYEARCVDLQKVLQTVRGTLRAEPLLTQLPIYGGDQGVSDTLTGVVDLVTVRTSLTLWTNRACPCLCCSNFCIHAPL